MTIVTMELWGQESTHQGFCPLAFGSPCLKQAYAEENGHRGCPSSPHTDSASLELGLVDD